MPRPGLVARQNNPTLCQLGQQQEATGETWYQPPIHHQKSGNLHLTPWLAWCDPI
jgi:hypothetical protein